MLLKDLLGDWPPAVHEPRYIVKPELRDVVVSAQNKGDGELVVRLRKPGKYGQEYNVTLRIPENAFQKTLLSIMRKKTGMTLGEIGEITIQ